MACGESREGGSVSRFVCLYTGSENVHRNNRLSTNENARPSTRAHDLAPKEMYLSSRNEHEHEGQYRRIEAHRASNGVYSMHAVVNLSLADWISLGE